MSHQGKLRESKRCDNCGHFVEKRFCPDCGQENVETRQRFHYIFTHYISDFIHYDSRFWKSILYLLFYPSKLTREYLDGKRKLYVPPVTLYIFICFITFFLPPILPDLKDKKIEQPEEISEDVKTNNIEKDTLDLKETMKETPQGINIKVRNEKIDSVIIKERIKSFNKEKLKENLINHFPKAVFFYLPIFAFWLWLFHSKKKWYYFDHCIYTFHYCSFILLCCLLYVLFNWFVNFFQLEIGIVVGLVTFVMFCYFIYYFFHSHRLVYGESKALSRLKCSFLFIINSICMLIFLLLYLIIEAFIVADKNLITEIINEINK